jgi:predicted nuclease of predicted toxin-antitoxin system
VNFLIDAQLPPALAQYLVNAGHTAQHVSGIGLLEASDDTVWMYARRSGAVIITKDEDFAARWARGDRVVPVVWLRIGNCSRRALIGWLLPQLSRITELLDAGETLIELR